MRASIYNARSLTAVQRVIEFMPDVRRQHLPHIKFVKFDSY